MPQEENLRQQSRVSAPWRYFHQKPFLRADREHTTILFGGFTWKHERILRGVLRAFGYRAEIIPTPTVTDFQSGKEYGNYGQCSPVYFTAGSLVNYLLKLERDGFSRQQIVDNYVYVTPESPCGPCRLGMYQSEYRLVVENAGFHGFRIIPVSQQPRLKGDSQAGLEINTDLSLALILGILMGDVVNDAAYSIRPFEVAAGETDRVTEEAVAFLERTVAGLDFRDSGPSNLFLQLEWRYPGIANVLKLHRWLRGAHFQALLRGLRSVGARFDSIAVDRTRVKPVVKVIGEFWDQMTEGDGNFQILQFLEKEGAQVLIEPVAAWFHLMIQWARQHNADYATLIAKDEQDITPRDRLRAQFHRCVNGIVIQLIDAAFRLAYRRMRAAMCDIPHELISQPLLARLAQPFYHSRLDAGEAHTEVGKNIYYHAQHLAHMVLSLKPFGCLPSTQSDAVQAAVQGVYEQMIFLPIETSGEGKVNALSRIQMALGEARERARKEFETAVLESGLGFEDARDAVARHPQLRRPSARIVRHPGTVGTAANLVYSLKATGARQTRVSRTTADAVNGHACISPRAGS
jgi:predicted nucleotide-binding protein (sugar kinase/HSP70/actin superfamily)